jgi:hypothetical protein
LAKIAKRPANRLLEDVFAVGRGEHDPDNEGPKRGRVSLNQLIFAVVAATPGVLNQAVFRHLIA